ncbi:MAG TPA: MMPL family transporter [Ornithinimicrobium sp.]|uniref:MMPL family transporter n=1 Tax=Ornithinimicrobium sp. TaxID=1977084 RepID=UPI002B4807E1|nr:MMPL family transporter [Ornithinimicrobium sp.]HKJ12912.1 MMPL family transporter [Ornithinimicrobium sp.]
MATFLYRLGSTAFRRWPVTLVVWLTLLVALLGSAAAFSKPLVDSFSIPGIPSEEASDLQAEIFGDSGDAFDSATVNVVVAAPEGRSLAEDPYAGQVESLIDNIADGPQVPGALSTEEGQAAVNPVTALQAQQQGAGEQSAAGTEGSGEGGDQGAAGAPQLSEQQQAAAAALSNVSPDGRIGVITFDFDVETVGDVEPASQDAVLEAMGDTARDDGLRVEANGPGMQSFAPPGGSTELIGIGLALVVLLLTFGSLVAAGLPILTAVVGLAIGLGGVYTSTAFLDLGSTTPVLATMIGLAVGIDYCLFILARYRTELEHTDDRAKAIGVAVGTGGSAVVFAGLTVLIALSALSVVRIPFLTTMGLAAAATVFVAVLVALTLLPGVLGMLGSRAFGGRVRRYRPARDDHGRTLNNGVRWARLVGRAPVLAVTVVIVGLGALAIPLKDLYLAFPTDSTAPSDTTQRQASELLADGFGPGREAPFQIVVDLRDVPEEDRAETTAEVADWAAGQDDVVGVLDLAALGGGAAQGEAGEEQQKPATEQGAAQSAERAPPGAQLLLVPQSGPDDPATGELLTDLRDGEPGIEDQTGATIGITGLTAITTDVSDRLNDALPVYLAVVVGLAFILLTVVFRSLLVPLTATFGFLLSVLATLGATVAVFQEGALGIFEGQPVVSFMPIFLIGVVFGLAMDYQVFLVTRMREAHVHGAETGEAVVDGFRNSARVVTAAAVIMTSVFAAFMFEDDPIITSIGFGLATAVVLDAFVVRMVLIPGLMYLLGARAWWLPRWLDRVLPDVDVEGKALERAHPGLRPDTQPEPRPNTGPEASPSSPRQRPRAGRHRPERIAQLINQEG